MSAESTPSSSTIVAATDEKVPKSVLAARQFIGGDITAASILKIPTGERNKLGVAFRKALTDKQKDEYKELATDELRREWMAQWVCDPTIGKKRGFSSTTVENKQHNVDREQFLLESQIAGPSWLNDKDSTPRTRTSPTPIATHPNPSNVTLSHDNPLLLTPTSEWLPASTHHSKA